MTKNEDEIDVGGSELMQATEVNVVPPPRRTVLDSLGSDDGEEEVVIVSPAKSPNGGDGKLVVESPELSEGALANASRPNGGTAMDKRTPKVIPKKKETSSRERSSNFPKSSTTSTANSRTGYKGSSTSIGKERDHRTG
jgi:hypothetical protein